MSDIPLQESSTRSEETPEAAMAETTPAPPGASAGSATPAESHELGGTGSYHEHGNLILPHEEGEAKEEIEIVPVGVGNQGQDCKPEEVAEALAEAQAEAQAEMVLAPTAEALGNVPEAENEPMEELQGEIDISVNVDNSGELQEGIVLALGGATAEMPNIQVVEQENMPLPDVMQEQGVQMQAEFATVENENYPFAEFANEGYFEDNSVPLKCNGCFSECPPASVITLNLCGHVFCEMCFKNHLVNVAVELNMFPLPCMVCKMALDPVFCLDFFKNEPGLYKLLANYVAQRHQQYRCQVLHDEDMEILSLPKEGPSELRVATCQSCMDRFVVTKSPMLCTHNFCESCMMRYLRILSTEKEVFPPSCPICRIHLDMQECLEFLKTTPWLKEEFELYIIYKQHISYLAYCANPRCSTPFDWCDNDNESCSELRFTVTCPLCKLNTCVRCKNLRTLDESCVSCLDVDLLRLADASGWRRCPGCGIVVSKIGGCEYVECRCGRTFNYYTAGSHFAREDSPDP